MQLTDSQIAAIARDFYLNGLNIEELSHKYDLSRYLIAKSLKDARDKQIVQISINDDDMRRNSELEYYFRQIFDLKEAYILRKGSTKTEDAEILSRFVANKLQHMLREVNNVGLTWGTTSMDIIQNFQHENLPNLTFVQLLGIATETGHRKNPLAQTAAYKFNASFQELPAPLYCANPLTIQYLKQEPMFINLKKYYNNLDMLLTGLGTFQSIEENKDLSMQYSSDLFKNIDTSKIAGFILGRPYTVEGKILDNLEPYICGIDLAELAKVPVRFIVEKSQFKSTAVLGALNSGLITHLAITEGIANRILQKIGTTSALHK
ncbi:ArsR family transcriptional regulator [Lactobacillus pasteurii DSM 23907 = CRBIP 24.76]|uniref:Transcriptional regulator n=1 Tax=Lactobacillus pasteurii DSM 23907 = CRBIP 24.76 TaxID=1423790 RepID=I7KMC4_9LACO|nr:sugar-binding domain-containing protein [Lactobacillus pasteurii]KRK08868.1 ArsR family transcriptional regulator [Lactobacillus pasteurii DSM 23907 = CRBIP 24.76]TDG76297.1 hypothetical protein C5L33_001056 [Lactobacillus pasteurii]CCI85979.1 Transcriptional regulator [Lactobacillus pasteurii DSM 23907 = CRBIP 24.76]